MTQFEFDLSDRVQKIKAINEQYDLENNSFISFSSFTLSYNFIFKLPMVQYIQFFQADEPSNL